MVASRIFAIGFLSLMLGATVLVVLAFLQRVEVLLSGDTADATITIDDVTVPVIGPLPISRSIDSMNANDAAKIALGKQLYFDGRLSKSEAIACAFCHNPGTGWADPRQTSIGIGGGLGGRQAPTVLNTGFSPLLFWDGRARSLEEQALEPIQNPIEMGETHQNVVRKLKKIKGYQLQFRAIFGTDPSLQGIAEAIAAFERTVISTNSAFDRYMRGDTKAMDAGAVRGMTLFKGKARCILCHNGPNFTDNQFHNLGVPQVGPMKEDLGRYYVTQVEKDRGAFKTPTLRSISETAPYMHDGAFKTLGEVIDFFNNGGGPNRNLSPLIKAVQLTAEQKKDLIAFLKALTGESIKFELPKLPQ
jgi:cytochrome c peroxidase